MKEKRTNIEEEEDKERTTKVDSEERWAAVGGIWSLDDGVVGGAGKRKKTE